MSLFLRQIAGYAAQKLASDPWAKEKAAKVVRVVVGEAKQIASEKDSARAAGRALRRVTNKVQGGR
jgi:hypothetical protein